MKSIGDDDSRRCHKYGVELQSTRRETRCLFRRKMSILLSISVRTIYSVILPRTPMVGSRSGQTKGRGRDPEVHSPQGTRVCKTSVVDGTPRGTPYVSVRPESIPASSPETRSSYGVPDPDDRQRSRCKSPFFPRGVTSG